jgi:hypothetical protein
VLVVLPLLAYSLILQNNITRKAMRRNLGLRAIKSHGQSVAKPGLRHNCTHPFPRMVLIPYSALQWVEKCEATKTREKSLVDRDQPG